MILYTFGAAIWNVLCLWLKGASRYCFMKVNYLILLITATLVFHFASCKKDHTGQNSHTYNLLNKSLDEIKALIAGTWKFQYDSSNGFAGPQRNPHTPNTYYTNNSYLTFLTKDTLVWTVNGNLFLRDTATITKIRYAPYNDSVYLFVYAQGAYAWMIDQIRNDTLVIEAGFLSGGGLRYYLTR